MVRSSAGLTLQPPPLFQPVLFGNSTSMTAAIGNNQNRVTVTAALNSISPEISRCVSEGREDGMGRVMLVHL